MPDNQDNNDEMIPNFEEIVETKESLPLPSVERQGTITKLDNYTTAEEVIPFAEMLIRSKLIPATFKTPEAVAMVVLQGRELGLKAITSLFNMYYISGKPTLSVHAIGALLRSKGIAWKTEKDLEPIKEGKDALTQIKFYRKEPVLGLIIDDLGTFTWSEAIAAGLTDKDVWKKHKRAMLWKTAFIIGARRIAPDVLTGVYETGELADAKDMKYDLDEEGNITLAR